VVEGGGMSTDVAVRDEPAVGPDDLTAWAEQARQVHGIAKSLAGTSFVAKALQGRADEVTGIILAGRELGIAPMSALRSIDIIEGTPAMRAHALRGLVQAHGHEIWVEESTDTRAVVCGRRRLSTHVERSVWSIDRAKKAGLAHKKVWQAHPAAMLIARATAEICRLVAADVLLGMPYAVEEIGDEHDDQEATPEAAALAKTVVGAARKRTAQRAKPVPARPDPAVEPELEPPGYDEPTGRPIQTVELPHEQQVAAVVDTLADAGITACVVDETVGAGPKLSEQQRRALMASYNRAGYTERHTRLEHAAQTLGRAVASANDLTPDEASHLLNVLNADEDWPPAARPPEDPDGY
jgi:hypothetical protein